MGKGRGGNIPKKEALTQHKTFINGQYFYLSSSGHLKLITSKGCHSRWAERASFRAKGPYSRDPIIKRMDGNEHDSC